MSILHSLAGASLKIAQQRQNLSHLKKEKRDEKAFEMFDRAYISIPVRHSYGRQQAASRPDSGRYGAGGKSPAWCMR